MEYIIPAASAIVMAWKYISLTLMELREQAYELEKCVEWNGSMITVDEANNMFLEYEAEGNKKAEELTRLIAAAKSKIREKFPD